MNFIYIHTHDSGREMEPYGVATHNPSLMKLAKESIMFRNAHCVAPTCSPSRAAMLTGMTAHNSGMYGLAHRGFSLNDYSQHLAQFLGRNGYYTALIGVQHEAKDPSVLGYMETHADHVKKGKPAIVSDKCSLDIAFEFLERKPYGDKPFFLSFGLRSTHRKFMDADDSRDGFVRLPYAMMDTLKNRHDYCEYLKTLDVADYCVGKLLDKIDEVGLRDDTVIMFTTDHGIAFPQMKGTLYDGGTGVALMFRIPGKEPFVSDALVSHIDVFPTVCDILELEKPEWLQGKSMLPIINIESDEINDYIFTESTYHATYEPARAVRTKNMKLIRFFEDDTKIRWPNIDASACKDTFYSSPLSHLARPKELMFDLVADPTERVNLMGFSEYAEEYSKLSFLLTKHMEETEDPLLHGPLELRDPWTMNKIDAMDPDDEGYNCRGEVVKAAKKK